MIYASIVLWQEFRNMSHNEIGDPGQLILRWFVIATWQEKWLAYGHGDPGPMKNKIKAADILTATYTYRKEWGSGAEGNEGDPKISLLHLSIRAPCALREHPQSLPVTEYFQ